MESDRPEQGEKLGQSNRNQLDKVWELVTQLAIDIEADSRSGTIVLRLSVDRGQISDGKLWEEKRIIAAGRRASK